MDPVVHFEMPYENRERMAAFYSEAFGWKPQMLGPEMGEYVVMETSETENGRPKNPGTINGGFYKKAKDSHSPSIVIAVTDIRNALQKIADAGGTVLGGQTPGEPDDIPGVGLYAAIIDTEGNRVGLLEPQGM